MRANPSNPVLTVADASVLARWVLPDESCNGADHLLADVASKRVTLLAPPLLVHELANVLSVATRRKRMPTKDAMAAWQSFQDLGILFGEPRWSLETLRLSFLQGVSAYDASYVALANQYRCAFYTADKKLAAALLGSFCQVRMIDEYAEVGRR